MPVDKEPAIKDWGAILLIVAVFGGVFGLRAWDDMCREPEPTLELICLDAEGRLDRTTDSCSRRRAVPVGTLNR